MEKVCPFEGRCVFLHEDSKPCKYDKLCERDLCMFKHGKREEQPENVLENIDVIDILEAESVCGDAVGEIDDETEIEERNENESVNKNFLNPSQEKNKVSKFKCLQCDFKTETKVDIVEHKRESHNCCAFCFSTFNSQEILKEHVDNINTDKKRK